MTINSISGTYGSYGSYKVTSRTTNSSASKVSVSETGSSEATSTKVSSALSDEYIEQIKAQARADAAKGSYMDGYDSTPRTGYAAMRDAHMKQYVSPADREKAIAQASTALNNPNRVWKYGENLLDLLDVPYTAKVFNGPLYGKTAEIRNEDGEMIAAYRDSCGWFACPTEDESRFQYESNQIYYAAYNAAKAEIAAAQQTAAPAQGSGETAGFDVKA